jgi:lipoprotein-anchoring transpeptidase ErfK/SrfK
MNPYKWLWLLVIGGGLIAVGCLTQKKNQAVQASRVIPEDINLTLSISQRKLFVMRGADTLRSYDVAVGQKKYPTPVGKFKIHRIDWNPEWNPSPESDWTKDKTYEPPGDPDNPMGRVRIVYKMPYTIHGTKEIHSLGKALSHGSVRMANEDVIDLAKFLMSESGTEKPEDWYETVLANPKKMVSVKLNKQIPLTNAR